MSPDLSRRAARAMDVGMASAAERDAITAAVEKASTFAGLPPRIQKLIERLEQPPT